MTKGGSRSYVYYRCAKYTKAGHPRIRVPEADLDRQVLAIFDRMRIEDESVRDWFRAVLASQTRDAQAESMSQRSELQRQETLLVQQQDRLLLRALFRYGGEPDHPLSWFGPATRAPVRLAVSTISPVDWSRIR
jgi:alkylated DNA nucleotide flippase Atl1